MEKVLWFRDDDAGYLAWLQENPGGFVLNMYHKPTASYLVLHRASCRTISVLHTAPGGFTERKYSKACADTPEALRAFAKARTGASDITKPCSSCAPFAAQ